MRKDYILTDTAQTKRLKELCLSNSAYSCGGDIYKLLNYDTLHELVKKIPEKTIKLKSSLLYGKDTITSEEKFLENLDKYIGYVKDNYFIKHSELTLLIELTLNNKYNEILFEMDDFHENENYIKYHDAFRKMFLYNFYDNICFYSKFVNRYSSINLFLDEIKYLDFDDSEDIILIENYLSKIISNRFDNVYNSFIPYNEAEEKQYNFYIHQVDWVLSDYYEKGTYKFDIKDTDYYIDLYGGDKLIFNILKNKKFKDEILVRFGIINKNFCADKVVIFRKKEFKNILNRLKKIDVSKKYDETYDFVDPSLRFNFWNEEGIQFLDIFFEYSDNISNKYMVALDTEDTKNLYELICKQV